MTQGWQAYHAGDNAAAERVARAVLEREPSHAGAWTLLGATAYSNQDFASALQSFERALIDDAQNADVHFFRGLTLEALNRPEEALAAQQEVVRLQPRSAAAYYHIGRLIEATQPRDAERCFRQALALNSDYWEAMAALGLLLFKHKHQAEALPFLEQSADKLPALPEVRNALGAVYAESGRIAEGVAQWQALLKEHPQHLSALNNLGTVLLWANRPHDACAYFQQALQVQPEFAEASNNLGWALVQLGRFAEGIPHFHAALRVQPKLVRAWHNLGFATFKAGQHDEGLQHLQEAIRLDPNFYDAYGSIGFLLAQIDRAAEGLPYAAYAAHHQPASPHLQNIVGFTLLKLKRYDEALKYLHEAIRLKPDFADAYNFLAYYHHQLMDLESAVEHWKHSVSLNPRFTEPRNNIGLASFHLGRDDESLRWLDEVVKENPNLTQARANRALVHLRRGNFEAGWADYEYRVEFLHERRPHFRAPAWDGKSFAGQTILLHSEQGFGDSFQFIRYVPYVKALGGEVICEVPGALLKVLHGCAGVDRLVGEGQPVPAFDIQAPLASLPRLLGRLETPVPYLFADPKLLDLWREKLKPWPGFKVGISWQGDPTYQYDKLRSVPLRQFAPLAQVPGVTLFVLQKHFGRDQLDGSFPYVDLNAELDNERGSFMDSAAAMMNLDLVVSSDTAIVHLAGALGARIWMATQYAPDWRWFSGREDSPWYPTMRLFRQPKMRDWESVFARMADELRTLTQ